ncbi:MAG: pre-peptidase C-terminal domain-containing protein [Treponema sp.]|jgi:hypothetical protein|nr:pre-peptidase C-terminal domain-containing protein [Treponema sp.]
MKKKFIFGALLLCVTLLIPLSLFGQEGVTDITPGSSRSATLSVGGVHTYRVTVSGNVTLAAYTEGSLDTYIRVFNASGTQIASDDDSGSSLNARISVNVTDGTYTIQVSGYGNSSGSYTLHVSTSSGSQASNPYANTRWVYGGGNNSITISLTNTGWTMVVVSSGETVNAAGTYTYSGNNIRFLRSNSLFATATVEDNIMFLKVNDSNYELIKQTSSGSIIDITPGSSHSATLPARGTHTYRVTVTGNVTLIAFTEGSVDTYIRLLNASGTQIASDDDSGSSLNARISVNVTSGTYTIQVSGYENSSGSYTLYVSTSGGGSKSSSGSQASNPYANTRWVSPSQEGNNSLTITLTNNGWTMVGIIDGRRSSGSGTYTYSGDSIRFLSTNSSAVPTAIVVDNVMVFELNGYTMLLIKQ